MNKLKFSKAGSSDLASICHLPIGIHGRRPGLKAETRSDCHYNKPLTSTHFSSRPPIEYSGSQHDSQKSYSQAFLTQSQNSQQISQQSYSQAVLTQSRNSQQISQQSGEDFGLPNYSWWNGSRARHLINKRPRSPNHEARPKQVPHNSKDGRSDLVLASQLTAQTLLQQISNRPGPTDKCTLTEVMERLMEIQNCLNGMLKRLDELHDELQEKVFSVKAYVKDAARESDITRKEAALQQNVLQSLVDTVDDCKRSIMSLKTGPEAMRDEMEMQKLEELSDELKKIPTSIAERFTELKVELLQGLTMELQCIFSERQPIAEVIPVQYEDQRNDLGQYKNIQRGVKGQERARHDYLRMPIIKEGARQICHETTQTLTKTRLQRRMNRCSALE